MGGFLDLFWKTMAPRWCFLDPLARCCDILAPRWRTRVPSWGVHCFGGKGGGVPPPPPPSLGTPGEGFGRGKDLPLESLYRKSILEIISWRDFDLSLEKLYRKSVLEIISWRDLRNVYTRHRSWKSFSGTDSGYYLTGHADAL